MRRATKGQLVAGWTRVDRYNDLDLVADAGPGCDRADARLAIQVLGQPWRWIDGTTDPALIDQLKKRGYDLSTLRFSIRKLKP